MDIGDVDRANQPEPAALVRHLVRSALTAALATIDGAGTSGGGHPYASLVAMATDAGGRPLLLLSTLARHTRNALADARVSVLVAEARPGPEPLTAPRATLVGRLARIEDAGVLARYLARHPSANGYAGFGDFALYRLEPERAHLVAGFGRIVDVPAAHVVTDTAGAEPLIAAEAEIVAHMNGDHGDAVSLYAERLARSGPGAWRITGVDPDGIDMVAASDSERRAARVRFAARVTTPQEARLELVRLAAVARQMG